MINTHALQLVAPRAEPARAPDGTRRRTSLPNAAGTADDVVHSPRSMSVGGASSADTLAGGSTLASSTLVAATGSNLSASGAPSLSFISNVSDGQQRSSSALAHDTHQSLRRSPDGNGGDGKNEKKHKKHKHESKESARRRHRDRDATAGGSGGGSGSGGEPTANNNSSSPREASPAGGMSASYIFLGPSSNNGNTSPSVRAAPRRSLMRENIVRMNACVGYMCVLRACIYFASQPAH